MSSQRQGFYGWTWLLSAALSLASLSPIEALEVTESTYEAIDVARGGRKVVATLYLPKNQTAPAPAVAFAHGFGLGPGLYPVAQQLAAQHGMVVLLPHDWGVLPSTRNLALDQVFLLAHAVEQSKSNPSSPLYGRVANRTLLAGHSLGGGSSILAADTDLAAGYPTPTALATMSLGTYTIPGALSSAPKISPKMPALLLTASQDCIDPPAKNSVAVFEALTSRCAFVVSVTGGSHCQYAAESWGCSLTEKLCGARPNITRSRQTEVALSMLAPFLRAALGGGSAAWASFSAALDSAVDAGEVEVLARKAETCAGPASVFV